MHFCSKGLLYFESDSCNSVSWTLGAGGGGWKFQLYKGNQAFIFFHDGKNLVQKVQYYIEDQAFVVLHLMIISSLIKFMSYRLEERKKKALMMKGVQSTSKSREP